MSTEASEIILFWDTLKCFVRGGAQRGLALLGVTRVIIFEVTCSINLEIGSLSIWEPKLGPILALETEQSTKPSLKQNNREGEALKNKVCRLLALSVDNALVAVSL